MSARDPATGRFRKPAPKAEPPPSGAVIVLGLCVGVMLGCAWLLFFQH